MSNYIIKLEKLKNICNPFNEICWDDIDKPILRSEVTYQLKKLQNFTDMPEDGFIGRDLHVHRIAKKCFFDKLETITLNIGFPSNGSMPENFIEKESLYTLCSAIYNQKQNILIYINGDDNIVKKLFNIPDSSKINFEVDNELFKKKWHNKDFVIKKILSNELDKVFSFMPKDMLSIEFLNEIYDLNNTIAIHFIYQLGLHKIDFYSSKSVMDFCYEKKINFIIDTSSKERPEFIKFLKNNYFTNKDMVKCFLNYNINIDIDNFRSDDFIKLIVENFQNDTEVFDLLLNKLKFNHYISEPIKKFLLNKENLILYGNKYPIEDYMLNHFNEKDVLSVLSNTKKINTYIFSTLKKELKTISVACKLIEKNSEIYNFLTPDFQKNLEIINVLNNTYDKKTNEINIHSDFYHLITNPLLQENIATSILKSKTNIDLPFKIPLNTFFNLSPQNLSLHKNKDFLEYKKEEAFMIKLLTYNSDYYNILTYTEKLNKDFALIALNGNKKIPSELWLDKDFCVNALSIQNKNDYIKNVPDFFWNDEEFLLKLFKKVNINIKKLPSSIRNFLNFHNVNDGIYEFLLNESLNQKTDNKQVKTKKIKI